MEGAAKISRPCFFYIHTRKSSRSQVHRRYSQNNTTGDCADKHASVSGSYLGFSGQMVDDMPVARDGSAFQEAFSNILYFLVSRSHTGNRRLADIKICLSERE